MHLLRTIGFEVKFKYGICTSVRFMTNSLRDTFLCQKIRPQCNRPFDVHIVLLHKL